MLINCLYLLYNNNKKTNIMRTLKDFGLALLLWIAFFSASLLILNVI